MGRLVYAVAASAALCVQATGVPAQAAVQPRASVEGDLQPALRTAIVRAVGDADRPIQNRFEARRRAQEAADDAVAVLRSEGYYANEVIPDVGDGDIPTPLIHVTPGPQFLIQRPAIAWVGEEPAATAVQAATAAMLLKDGAPGRAADVVGAEGRVVAAVQSRGYADAAADPREVVVDHADKSVQPTYHIRAGALVRMDGIKLSTKGHTDKRWLRSLAPWKSGQPYTPDAVAELERRLLDAGVYDSVTVALAPIADTTPDGLRPVVVSLAERKRRTVELAASYDTSEGAGAEAKLTRYNLLGRADTTSLLFRLSRIDSRIAADISLPHWQRPQQTLKATVETYKVSTDAYDESGAGVRADVERRFHKTSFVTVGASVYATRTDEIRIGTLTPLGRDLVTFGTLADLSLDRSDDPLNPKHGWRFGVRGEPTLIVGDGEVPYVKLQVQGSAYLPLGAQAKTVLAGRVHVGSIVGGSLAEIPASQRFYAGGGGSVRGFGYQAVGPRLSDGTTPQGGLTLFEGSLELRRDITQRWGVVAFVDAGGINSGRLPGPSNVSTGAGLGVRYNLGFAPIRVDVGVPVTNRQGAAPFQVYVSIGQSF